MSFRRRIAIVSAAAVAIAVVLASVLIYVLTSDQLHGQIDTQLRTRGLERTLLLRRLDARGQGGRQARRRERLRIAAERALSTSDPDAAAAARHLGHGRTASTTAGNIFGGLTLAPDQVLGYQQVVNASGHIVERSRAAGPVSLPVESRTRALAEKGGEPFLRYCYVDGIHLRVLAAPLGTGHAVQFAQPLTEVDSLLGRLRLILALVLVGGIALAALLGRLVAGAAVLPLKRLTNAAEHVALTQDLTRRIQPSPYGEGASEDELGRLAVSFNAMLDALERSMSALDASVHAQRQLVADASHELRTPVTSLRTNIEILQQQGQHMDREDHDRLLSDVVEQIGQLTLLMNDLIDLARGEEPRSDTEDVRLDALAGEVIERAGRQNPNTPIHSQLDPTVLTGVPARLERAVSNLVDNAVKYSPQDESVEVELHAGELTVRDHGPGISKDDLPHVFDRFYRGAEARGRPGSGLGLAIVRQVASEHGGTITAEQAPGGGTLMRLHLPGAEPLTTPPAPSAEGEGVTAGSDAAYESSLA